MPVEVNDWKEFVGISTRALECRVKYGKDGSAKVKARTKRVLYTIKVEKAKVEDLVRELKCPKIIFVDTGEVRESKKEG